jgi:hypothetical protein
MPKLKFFVVFPDIEPKINLIIQSVYTKTQHKFDFTSPIAYILEDMNKFGLHKMMSQIINLSHIAKQSHHVSQKLFLIVKLLHKVIANCLKKSSLLTTRVTLASIHTIISLAMLQS